MSKPTKIDPFTGREYIELNGFKVYVGTPDECAAATFVVCGPQSFFPDDVATRCSVCRALIFHRPYIPSGPRRICLSCACALSGPKEEA